MSAVKSFRVPPGIGGFEAVELPHQSASAGSPASDDPALLLARFSSDGARRLVTSLREAGTHLAQRSALELVESLGRVGRRFLEPRDPLRLEAQERLPSDARISGPMASAIIEGMARDWCSGRLERLLRSEFPDPLVLDGFRPDGAGQRSVALGGSFAFHVGSGNVPGVGATSVIRSLLVKCPVLLKPGRGDLTLSCLFARGLEEEDVALASAAAVVYWPRGEGGDLESLALEAADRVVAYGGDGLMDDLRRRLPSTTPLVAYHHRLSVGAIAREQLSTPLESTTAARSAARSVATFDQRGCVSPQVIWVEEGARVRPESWAEGLARELREIAPLLPPGTPTPAGALALHQLTGTVELKRAAGGGERVFTDAEGAGTVLFDPEPQGIPTYSGTGRTVVVKPIEDLSQLPDVLRPFAPSLQTLALAAPEQRRLALAESFVTSGVTRVTTFRRQSWPPAWWRHDGMGPLRALVRWAVLESDEPTEPR